MRISAMPAALALAVLLTACGARGAAEGEQLVPDGDAARGQEVIRQYGCTGCHAVPGVASVDDGVGPDLHDLSDERYLAGQVPNRPEELIRWLQDPQDVEPGTLMPDMGVTEQDARDIAAYLYGG
jgi:cytochrome c